MWSAKAAAACIGVGGTTISLLHDLFGHEVAVSGPGVKPWKLSLLTHLQRLKGLDRLDLNVIFIGVDAFTIGEKIQVDKGTEVMRGIYAQVGLAVGRIKWFGVTVADADGFDVLSSDSDAFKLPDHWTVHDDGGIDMFVVRAPWGTTVGYGPNNGPCDKDNDLAWEMSGVVIAAQAGNASIVGADMAHEVGHYFGLPHSDTFVALLADPDEFNEGAANVMFPTVGGTQLTPFQGEVMREHCLVKDPCP